MDPLVSNGLLGNGEERMSMWWADFLFEREDAQALTTRSASDVALDMVWM